jgi:enoyl-CoA hydratase/carnithine racemase
MSELRTTKTDGIARIVFDRPDVLNALSPEILEDLIDTCDALAASESTKVVVFEGAGGTFSAGADLPAFLAQLGETDPSATADLGRRATNAIADLPQITIAGITGHCVGGGLVLAGACDIRLASDEARFLIPELDAGIPLAWGGIAHLVRLIGETVTADLVLSCRPFDADEALRCGLVSRVIPHGTLEPELGALASSIAKKPTFVLRTTKDQLKAVRAGNFDARADAGALLSALNDPESLEAGRRYISERIRRAGGAA